GVDRRPLGPAADRRIACAEVRKVRLSSEQGSREALLAGEAKRLFDIVSNAREALEIAVDDELAFLLGNAQPPRQPPGGDAVEARQTDGLRLGAIVAVGGPKEFLRRHVVDVGAVAKGALELQN